MARKYTVRELAQLTGAEWCGDGEREIEGVADLSRALPSELSFFANPRYATALQNTRAGAVCVAERGAAPASLTLLIHADPSRTFQRIAELLTEESPPLTGFLGVHATAVVHHSAVIGKRVTLCPYAVVDAYAVIGDGCHIGPHAYIGPHVSLGKDCLLHAHAVIREGCRLGERVILQPGAVIGSCGFGYTTSPEGRHEKLEQIGAVIIGNDVEIGANTTVDRGRFLSQSTQIGDGTKLDNMVQIGHGVHLGADVLMAGQSGVAGSTEIGSGSMIGGQTAIAGHLTLQKVRIAGKSGVSKSLEDGTYGGIPAQPISDYNRNAVLLRKMPLFTKQLKTLQELAENLAKKIMEK